MYNSLMMELKIKRFNELTPDELYRIAKLRVDVFVVEQNCAYREFDDLDQDAIHVWLEEDGKILSYLRVLDRGVESEYPALGRVISAVRGEGLGARIMQEGIKVAREVYNAEKIYLEAQTYATKFYEKQGFHVISDEFMMDGIPHYKMLWEKE